MLYSNADSVLANSDCVTPRSKPVPICARAADARPAQLTLHDDDLQGDQDTAPLSPVARTSQEGSSYTADASPGPSLCGSCGSIDSGIGSSPISQPDAPPDSKYQCLKRSPFKNKPRPQLAAVLPLAVAERPVNPFEPGKVRKVRSCTNFFEQQDQAQMLADDKGGPSPLQQHESGPHQVSTLPTRLVPSILKGGKQPAVKTGARRALLWAVDV
eukprot:TRINITY_DN16694_c0_g1_i1.p2 TRINITY_DN16694_c0_g1~~TRINITY_DN16694_c0_g1_i1.p2  ORF type:complete len:214 (+),score=62.53 TRINITY_DN16694_c0_g1_i1:290-931(+)